MSTRVKECKIIEIDGVQFHVSVFQFFNVANTKWISVLFPPGVVEDSTIVGWWDQKKNNNDLHVVLLTDTGVHVTGLSVLKCKYDIESVRGSGRQVIFDYVAVNGVSGDVSYVAL